MQAAADWQANAAMFQAPSSAITAPGIIWAGAALDQRLYNLFQTTCDWSWSWIPRPPRCTSTRNHQDCTGVAAAAAAWILVKTISVQSMQEAADWQANAAMFQAPSSAITAPGIIWAGAALDQRLYNLFQTTCDWSWSWIPRPPSCTSTRNHQDCTGVAAAAAAWILMKTISVNPCRKLLTDKQMLRCSRPPPLQSLPLESSELELP